jgi:radical SAM protein with 4Fe4S-binding SPASM domain
MIDKVLLLEPSHLTITGGEPLLRPDFGKIIMHIRGAYSRNISLLTNGTLITKANVDLLAKNFSNIVISIDGYDEESSLKIRGAGVFNRVIESIRLLQSVDYNNISLSTIITKDNITHENDFRLLCKNLGVHPLLRNTAPMGNARAHYELLFGDNLSLSQPQGSSKQLVSPANYALTFSCKAASAIIHIDSDGSIYPCSGLLFPEFYFSNIFSIKDVHSYFYNREYKKCKGYENLLACMPEQSPTCAGCSIREFCIECLIYPYAFKKIGLFDEYCKIRKSSDLERIVWQND